MSYDFDYEKEDKIRNIGTQRLLKEYIAANAKTLNRYQWYLISKSKYFNLEMVRDEYLGMLDWEAISMNIPLSIKELETYSGYVNWFCVSAFQKLTINFIEKYKDFLSLDVLLNNSSLDKETEAYAQKVYRENNNMEHYIVWRDNLINARTFRPHIEIESKTPIIVNCPDNDAISKMQKAELKQYLDQYHVRYLYKNTLDELKNMLREKCKELLSESKKSSEIAEDAYAKILLQRIIQQNHQAEVKVEKTVDYNALTKAELKKILDERKIRYLYKDTIDILREKCRRSDDE